MNRAKSAVMAIIMATAGHALADYSCTGSDGKAASQECARKAEAKVLASQFVDQSKSPIERLAALQKLRTIDPALADKFEPTRQKLLPLAARQNEDFLRKLDSIGAVMGIKVGMTADQVLTAQAWGRPERINKTIVARGTKEQWVYGAGRYVYIENGIVTAIQSPW